MSSLLRSRNKSCFTHPLFLSITVEVELMLLIQKQETFRACGNYIQSIKHIIINSQSTYNLLAAQA